MGVSEAVLVGRDDELEQLVAAARGHVGVLLLEGEAGIGKTALWQRGLAEAHAAGAVVLSSRPGQSEAAYSFAVLADLVGGIERRVLDLLPVPQRQALDVALLLEQLDELEPLEPRAVATAFLSALRELAKEARVVVAVDDLQWVDEPSATALGFALRRLEDEPVSFLLARRSGAPLPAGLSAVGADRIELRPLSVGATRLLLEARLGSALTRPAAQQVHATAGGNPYFALELGRALAVSGGELGPSGELPVPRTLEELLADRLDDLPPGAEAALCAAALASSPRMDLVQAASREGAAEAAVRGGVLVVDGDMARPSHPLLGAVARSRATEGERRALHRRLAELVDDPEERARHLALATVPPDAGVAASLAEAAATARARGSAGAAAALAEEAWRFTPVDAPERDRRLVTAADQLMLAGQDERMGALLDTYADSVAPGPLRGWAYRYLSMVGSPRRPWEQLFEAALAEAGDDLALRVNVLVDAAGQYSVTFVSDIPRARALAEEAHELARSSDDVALTTRAVVACGWTAILRGVDPAPWLEQARPLDHDLCYHANRVRALHHLWRGEVEPARSLLESLRDRAVELEEDWSTLVFTLHLFELAQRVGDAVATGARLAELETATAGNERGRGAVLRCRALYEAARGRRADVEADVLAVLATADAPRWQQLEGRRALGVAALVAGDHALAATHLQAVVDDVAAAGVGDPGSFPAAPDLVESLVALGRLDEAERELARLAELAAEQAHPWALAAAGRCRGLLLAAAGELAASEDVLRQAIEGFDTLHLPRDRARTLLALGKTQRLAQRRREARETLEEAVAELATLGADGFAEQARRELARLGGRRAAEGLTATEERVAALAADGRTNRQIAAELVLTVRTVEAHLTRIYAKLGVRSRTELARSFVRA